MAEVNHQETFDCTPQQFFDLLKDYESYPKFLNEVTSCRIVEDNGNEKMVEYKVSVVKSITYINKQTETAPNEISWEFVKGDLFKKMKGHWKLEDVGGKTKASYHISAEFGMFVPKMIVKTALSANLPLMMKAHHKRVKELYG